VALARVDWVTKVLIEGCKENMAATRLLTMLVRLAIADRRMLVVFWVVVAGGSACIKAEVDILCEWGGGYNEIRV